MTHSEIIPYMLKGMPKCTSICIAGGAAVDANMAGDVDVWFRQKDNATAKKYLNSFTFHTFNESGYNSGDGAMVVGEAYDPTLMKIIQVLTYGHKNLDNLLKSFDISTHQKAILATGTVVEGPGYTSPEKAPKILLWKNKTFARYVKICQRYGHPVDVEMLKNKVPNMDGVMTFTMLEETYKKYTSIPKVNHNAYLQSALAYDFDPPSYYSPITTLPKVANEKGL